MHTKTPPAPRRISSAAARNDAALVLEYLKQPLSVESAMYKSVASRLVMLPRSAFMTSSTISPQEERSSQRRVLAA